MGILRIDYRSVSDDTSNNKLMIHIFNKSHSIEDFDDYIDHLNKTK